jgi:hypothetical protein
LLDHWLAVSVYKIEEVLPLGWGWRTLEMGLSIHGDLYLEYQLVGWIGGLASTKS